MLADATAWVSLVSSAVVAGATVALACFTAGYVVLTRKLAKHLREQVAQMAKQSDQLRVQDQARVNRALAAIVQEIVSNRESTQTAQSPRPLLHDAYSAHLWAFAEKPILPATRSAIERAHGTAMRATSEYHAHITTQRDLAHPYEAWDEAKRASDDALNCIREDPVLAPLLGPDLANKGQA